jgi:hypothetical protein
LIKKASLDPAFSRLLLEQRATAAREIQLELTPAETAILDSVPEVQLQAMIDKVKVPDAQRRAFLGGLGAAMLAAVAAGCTPPTAVVEGIRPEQENATSTPETVLVTQVIEVVKGIRTDPVGTLTPTPEDTPTSPPVVTGTRPEQEETPPPQVVRGTRPDRP